MSRPGISRCWSVAAAVWKEAEPWLRSRCLHVAPAPREGLRPIAQDVTHSVTGIAPAALGERRCRVAMPRQTSDAAARLEPTLVLGLERVLLGALWA